MPLTPGWLLARRVKRSRVSGIDLRTNERRHDVRKALAGSGIFHQTDPAKVDALTANLLPVHLSAGHALGAHSDFGQHLYVIISGKVKLTYRRADGREILLRILGPAEIVGAITLFDPDSREINAVALTEVRAVPIHYQQLLAWINQCPEVGVRVLRLFARRAKATRNILADCAFADVQCRVATRLLLLMQRFGRQEGEEVRIVHDLTLADFSLAIGVARKAVLTVLRDFEQRGLIRLDGDSVMIADAHALRQCGR